MGNFYDMPDEVRQFLEMVDSGEPVPWAAMSFVDELGAVRRIKHVRHTVMVRYERVGTNQGREMELTEWNAFRAQHEADSVDGVTTVVADDPKPVATVTAADVDAVLDELYNEGWSCLINRQLCEDLVAKIMERGRQ